MSLNEIHEIALEAHPVLKVQIKSKTHLQHLFYSKKAFIKKLFETIMP